MSKELIEQVKETLGVDGDSIGKKIVERIEELELKLDAEQKRNSAYKTLVSAMEKQEEWHDEQRKKFRESCATLDSERAANERLTIERDALQADNARLREALENVEGMLDELRDYPITHDMIIEALVATPEQSLARLRNQVREEAAKIADAWDCDKRIAAAIRASKEPE